MSGTLNKFSNANGNKRSTHHNKQKNHPQTSHQSQSFHTTNNEINKFNEKQNEKLYLDTHTLFELLKDETGNSFNICKIVKLFTEEEKRNTNIMKYLQSLKKCSQNMKIDFENFRFHTSSDLIDKLMEKVLHKINEDTIAEESENLEAEETEKNPCPFINKIADLYHEMVRNHHEQMGFVKDFSENLDKVGVSICLTNGKKVSFGDVSCPFPMQSLYMPFLYGLAIEKLGHETVHKYVGTDAFPVDDYTIRRDKPFNPLVPTGAIMICSLLEQLCCNNLNRSEKFDQIMEFFQKICTERNCCRFKNSIYIREKENDLSIARGYLMKYYNAFPGKINRDELNNVLDLYFQLQSLEISCNNGAVMAALLANSGRNPVTNNIILTPETTENITSAMSLSGLNRYSNEFYFQTQYPAMGCSSGGIIMVVPGVMGLCCYSPILNKNSISCQGIAFCLNLAQYLKSSTDPNHVSSNLENNLDDIFKIIMDNDLIAVSKYFDSGKNMFVEDYAGRNILHVAVMCNHENIVRYLMENCIELSKKADKIGETPIQEAKRRNYRNLVDLMETWSATY